MASLLELITDAADDIGLPRITSVIGNTDPMARGMLRAAQREGIELAGRHAWRALKFEKTFTSVAALIQTSAVPTDYDRTVPDTFWNRTQTRPVEGPISEQEYAEILGRGTTYFHQAYLMRGSDIVFVNIPTAGETMAYTYVSKYWVGGTGSTTPTKTAFAIDTDIPYLDDECMRLGIVWRFKKAKGLGYGEDFNAYEMRVAQIAGRDGGRRILDMNSSRKRGRGDVTVIP